MSIKYDVNLLSNSRNTVKINLSGIDAQNNVNADSLYLEIYAYETSTGKPVFNGKLGIKELRKLYGHLDRLSLIKRGAKSNIAGFVEVSKGIKGILSSTETGLVTKFMKQLSDDGALKGFLETIEDDVMIDLGTHRKLALYKKESDILEKLVALESDSPREFVQKVKKDKSLSQYGAGKPETVFQRWLDHNTWALGREYVKKYKTRDIGIGTEADLIMESQDGYVDLIELKRPSAKVFIYDGSHKCYYPSSRLSKAIGQGVHYLNTLEEHRMIVQSKSTMRVLKPRVTILIGETKNFSRGEHDTLRLLNSNLNHVKIMTFSHLENISKSIINAYSGPKATKSKDKT